MANEIPPSDEIEVRASRSRLGSLMGVQILGLGSSAPDNVVRNEDLASLGHDPDWIVKRTGILERRHVPEGMATSDLAVEAAQRCIERTGVDRQDIDLVLVGTYTPDYLLPTTACLVQDRLGIQAPAMDLHAACAGFVFGLITGMQYVATGCSRLVLVIGADCNSRVVDPTDKRTFPLFGDAAGAVLLAAGEPQQGLVSYAIGSDGSGGNLLCRKMGGTLHPYSAKGAAEGQHFLAMKGKPVFKWAIRVLTQTVGDVLQAAQMELDDVDLIIFHQANMRILNSVIKELKIDREKVFINLERYGNTSAASIPLAMDEAFEQGRIKRGDHILFSGFGAGLAWGTVLLRW